MEVKIKKIVSFLIFYLFLNRYIIFSFIFILAFEAIIKILLMLTQ